MIFTCPYCIFTYRKMPFGLCIAPTTFQRCMIANFSNYLENIIEVFIDGFFVYGRTFDLHLENLTNVLCRCKKRAARCTSIPRSRRVRGRATSQEVNCRQPNLTLSMADSKAQTRDLLVPRRQPYHCSKASLQGHMSYMFCEICSMPLIP